MISENQANIQKNIDKALSKQEQILMYIVNIFLCIVLIILGRLCPIATILFWGYELFLLKQILDMKRGKNVRGRKYIGKWNIVVPISVYGFIYDFQYFEENVGLLSIQSLFIFTSLLFGILLWWCIFKENENYWISHIVLILLLSLSMYCQTVQLNILLTAQSGIEYDYQVQEKREYDGFRIPIKEYFLDFAFDEEHQCTLRVNRSTFDKVKEGDIVKLKVYRSIMGVQYLKSIYKSLKLQI